MYRKVMFAVGLLMIAQSAMTEPLKGKLVLTGSSMEVMTQF